MPYSAHRPGRYDSQGRIILHDDDPAPEEIGGDEPAYLEREFVPAGAETTASTASTAVIEDAPPAEPVPAPSPEAAAPRQRRAPRPRRERPVRVPGARLRRLAILGGADGHVLDAVPTETPRFVQMFFVLLGTAVVSALSMMFALTTGVQVSPWLAVPLAAVWAGIIFNLDRFLTSTMTATRSIGKLIGLAAPRLLMALVIGIVVAEPVVLQAFHNDIAREVASNNIVQSQEDQAALDAGPEKLALDEASQRLADLQNQAATGVVSGTSAESATLSAAQGTVDDLTAKLDAQQAVIDQARALYQCELDGSGAGEVAGCTGVQGEGASSEAAHTQLEQAQSTYDGLQEQLRDANEALAAAEETAAAETAVSETQNRAAAQDQLPAAQTAYDTALAAYEARASSVASTNAGAIGLLSQIDGLNRLADKEPAIWWAHLLIALLFLMIELLPVTVKVLTSWGEPSLYEKAAAARKEVALERVKADAFRDRADILTAQPSGLG